MSKWYNEDKQWSGDQEKWLATGKYPANWVHENNNRSERVPGTNETDRPIWGRDILGNRVCVGFEKLQPEPEMSPRPYTRTAPFGLSPWKMAFILFVTILAFMLLFSAAAQLSEFGQASGIAPAVNSALGLGPGGLP